MATVALSAAWIDTTGTRLFIAWEMTAGNWLGAPTLTGVPTLTVNGSGGPVATAHGVAKRGTSQWIARYTLASAISAGATVTVSASAGSCANGSITSSPSLSGAAVTNNSTGAASPTSVYVDVTGNVGGLGTEASPFCSVNEAKVYIASGVTIYARGGSQHEWDGANGFDVNASGTITDVSLRQWPNSTRFRLIGACQILGFDGNTTAGYRVDGMDVEPEFIGYGVDSMFITRTTTDPRTGMTVTFNHPSYGMEEALGAAEANQISACQANTTGIGLWAYDSAADQLWVHSTQGNGDPMSDSLGYYVLVQSAANAADKVSGPNESNGISIRNATRWYCDWDTAHWMERSTGYGVFFQTCVHCTIGPSYHSCLGRHGIGFAVNNCQNNTIDACVVDTAGTTTDSAIIFFSAFTNVEGCVASRLVVHACTILRWNATGANLQPLRRGGASAATNPTPAPGLAAHSSSGVTSINANGVIYRRCRVFSWTDALSTANPCVTFTGSHDTPLALEEPSLYAVLCEDCTFCGPVWGACSDKGVTAFDRCIFQGVMGTTNGTAGTDAFFRTTNSEVLFRSCVFSGTGESGTVASALLRSQNSDGDSDADRAHITVLNCTMYQIATNASMFDVRRYGSGGADRYGRITARRCIFRMADGGSSTSRLISGTTVTAAGGIRDRITFTDNIYDVNIPNNNFGFPDSSINTQAEFTSVEDTTGVYDVDLSATFESDVTLKPRFDAALNLMIAPEASYFGIDTRNNRRYGAWQMFDPVPARIRGFSRDDTTTRPILG